ncbi:MAG: efflux RND transporter permease subunit [Microcystis aeruginosa LG13-12]|jgi:HAE1 family hydrophobic/amphiphilic exporter-1|nr:efflux RND transporter permease subunit [Microcystis aeruginosa LG13-12]
MVLSISSLFIKRPVLATVCSLLIVLAGAIAFPLLPVAKLPQLAPTQVKVTATYIGADARTTEDTVTTILEREINGVENMKYISSNTSNDGVANITVAFPTNIDRNQAQVNVQNRVGLAEPRLPDGVKQTGVKVDKASPNILLAYAFFSEKDPSGKAIYDPIFISNYIDLNITDEIKRLFGVGSITMFGERKYAMRFWLDPDKLAARNLTAGDVVRAIEEQNLQVGAGRIGQEPTLPDQQFEIPLRSSGRFLTVEEAGELVVKVGDNGALITLADVGRVELGAENYDTAAFYNGEPAIGLAVYQLPGTNALATGEAIKKAIARLQASFPPGLKVEVAFDTTTFVNVAIADVKDNTMEAILYAIITIMIFLQNWRLAMIPAIAMPVAMVGAMAAVLGFGLELNLLTLFGIILAIGTVTDDAVVIVEAVQVKMATGMKPLQASLDAMNELGGAVIASALTQLAVFIPVAFFPGTTGIVYRQFAVTLAAAIVFSTFNAITLSPTLASLILRPPNATPDPIDRIFRFLFGWFFDLFNRIFGWIERRYGQFIEALTRIKPMIMIIFAAGLVATVFMYQVVPSGFIPEEDQGYFFVLGNSPSNTSLNYSRQQVADVGRVLEEMPEMQAFLGIAGNSFEGNNYNKYLFFARLKPWEERPGQDQSVFALLKTLNAKLRSEITGSKAVAINAPAVDGLSATGGLEFQLQNRAGLPMETMIEVTQKYMAAASQRPELQGVFTQFTFYTDQSEISLDRKKINALNIDVAEVLRTLQTYIGSNYVNDFVFANRQYRVYAQVNPQFRSNLADLEGFYVKSRDGALVQLSSVVTVQSLNYPPTLTHYNVYPSIKIQAAPAPGYSSGQAIKVMEAVAKETLPPSFGYEWTGSALEELSAGNATILIFGLGFVLVFLVLAAQYESYIDPTIIMLTVPLSTLGALCAIWFRANILQAGSFWPIISNDIYAQVGLLMLIGMASKNAILIVETANQNREMGLDFTEAAVEAAKSRFRPIMMTSLSGIVGYIPLMTAAGAGALSRWSIGTVSFGGYLVATLLSLAIAPILYIVIKTLEDKFLGLDVSKIN